MVDVHWMYRAHPMSGGWFSGLEMLLWLCEVGCEGVVSEDVVSLLLSSTSNSARSRCWLLNLAPQKHVCVGSDPTSVTCRRDSFCMAAFDLGLMLPEGQGRFAKAAILEWLGTTPICHTLTNTLPGHNGLRLNNPPGDGGSS